MPKAPHPKREQILSDLLEGIPPKVISATRDIAYATVIGTKERFFDVCLKLKKNIPDPRQMTFKF